jgi:hypothetical protein
LVKSHLTSAVNEEIDLLRKRIDQLNKTCARLEFENAILKQNATAETLALLETRLSQTPYPVQTISSGLINPTANSTGSPPVVASLVNSSERAQELMNSLLNASNEKQGENVIGAVKANSENSTTDK